MSFKQDLEQRVKEAMNAIPDLVAELAVDYFKERFSYKEFDGKSWPDFSPNYKHRTNGSLMIDSAKLMNSVRPTRVERNVVEVTAGYEEKGKVDYARPHNEGFSGSVVVPSHSRTSKKGKQYVVKQHTRKALIPQRQFLGESRELNRILKKDIEQLFKTIMEQ